MLAETKPVRHPSVQPDERMEGCPTLGRHWLFDRVAGREGLIFFRLDHILLDFRADQ